MKKIIMTVFILWLCFVASANTYVLIHPQAARGDIWAQIASILRSNGHRVIIPDLPGHGSDRTDPKEVTLESYCKRVIDSINTIEGKVILVGHGMAGMILTKVADMIPDRIAKLVYLVAVLPLNGQSVMDINDDDSLSQFRPIFNEDTTLLIKFNPTLDNVAIGCQDCPQAAKERILSRPLTPSPARPLKEKLYFRKENLDPIPIYYICATESRILTYGEQQKMIAANGRVEKVFTLHMSHNLPLIQATDVAGILNKL